MSRCDGVRSISMAPHGEFFVAGSSDGQVLLWDSYCQLNYQHWMDEDESLPVEAVLVMPDAVTVAVGTQDGRIGLWDLHRNQWRTLPPQGSPVLALSPTHDGRGLLSASGDGTLRMWDLDEGRVISTFLGHQGSVSGLALIPDTEYVLTCSDDGSVRVWNATTAQQVHVIYFDGLLDCLAFDADSRCVFVGDAEGVVYCFALEQSS